MAERSVGGADVVVVGKQVLCFGCKARLSPSGAYASAIAGRQSVLLPHGLAERGVSDGPIKLASARGRARVNRRAFNDSVRGARAQLQLCATCSPNFTSGAEADSD